MASNKQTKKLGWHFLPKDRTLTNGDGRKVKLGVAVRMKGGSMPSCCHTGMHASEAIHDAARYERGPVLCRVEVWGDIDLNPDKFSGRWRRVLWMREVTQSDLRQVAIAMGTPFLGVTCEVTEWLKILGGRHGTAFDREMTMWAKGHGAGDKTSGPEKPERPVLTEKDLIRLLAPRVVRTKEEILRDIGSYYDLTPDDEDSGDDLLDELIVDCNRIRTVDNIDGKGTEGYVLQTRRR